MGADRLPAIDARRESPLYSRYPNLDLIGGGGKHHHGRGYENDGRDAYRQKSLIAQGFAAPGDTEDDLLVQGQAQGYKDGHGDDDDGYPGPIAIPCMLYLGVIHISGAGSLRLQLGSHPYRRRVQP